MKMLTYFIFITIFITCCGTDKPAVIDPELQTYFNRFVEDHKHYTNNAHLDTSYFELEFVDEIDSPEDHPENIINGQCISYAKGDKRVEINRKRYDVMTEDTKYWLLYHELGHCLLDLPHQDKKYGIMNTFMLSPTPLPMGWEYYVQQLFTKGQ